MRISNSLPTSLWILLFGFVAAAPGQQPPLQPTAEALQARKVLQASADRFLAVLERVEEVDWNFRPKGFRHTLGQEAEHAALAHQELQVVVTKALRREPQPERAKALEGKEEMIRERMLDSAQKAESYAVKNSLRSKAEVLEFFQAAHKKALRLLAAVPDPGVHIYKHPHSTFYGELTGLQWFYYMAYHCERHAEHMLKMIEHPEFTGQPASGA